MPLPSSNAGAVAAGFLFKGSLTWPNALLVLGVLVLIFSFATFLVTFSDEQEKTAKEEFDAALKRRAEIAAQHEPRFRLPELPEVIAAFNPLAALRIFLGVALVAKGIHFIANMSTLGEMASMGALTTLATWYVVTAHVAGGAALALGLWTRGAAAANIVVMLGAAFMVHAADGLFGQGLQFSLLVLACLLTFAWSGSGRFSLDHFLRDSVEPH